MAQNIYHASTNPEKKRCHKAKPEIQFVKMKNALQKAAFFQFQEVCEEQLRDLEKQRQEHKLGILLVGISVLFISCQSFKIVPDLYEIMFCSDDQVCYTTPFVNTIVNLSHLLVCFNSSANFVIYLLGGEKFRRVWCETYLCRRGQPYFEDAAGQSLRQQTFRMTSLRGNRLTTTTRSSSITNRY